MSVLRIGVAIVTVALVVWLVILPQFGDVRADLARLGTVPPVMVGLAAAAETLSLLTFSVLSRAVLGEERLPYRSLLAIDLADLAANHTLPGGGATAAAMRYHLVHAEGVSSRRALGMATVETAISNAALAMVFAVGALLVSGRVGPDFAFVVAGIATGVVIAIVVLSAWVLLRYPSACRRWAARIGKHIPLLRASRAEVFVAELSSVLRELRSDRRRAVTAAAASLANWILDALALWLVLAAFGQPIGIGVLLAAYGAGTLLGQLPLTPGGLGVVEGTVTVLLVALGVAHAPAVLAVIGWRVFEFWLPIPIGWACYLALRVRRGIRPAGST